MTNLAATARDLPQAPRDVALLGAARPGGDFPATAPAPTAAPSVDREALQACRLNVRMLHDVAAPETAVRLLGLDLAMPVLAAPVDVSGLAQGPATDLAGALVGGLADAGLAALAGDGEEDWTHRAALADIRGVRGRGIPVFWAWDEPTLTRRIEAAEQAGCAAVGLDIGALNPAERRGSRPAGARSPARLARIIRQTPLPFVVHGVMTPDEACLAADAGAAAVVVSGRRWREAGHVPGVAEVLPWIVEALGGQCAILADGGVCCGADVLKLLALGADAALVGRPFAAAACSGRQAVSGLAHRLLDELAQAMVLTGTSSASSVSRSVLYVRR